MNQKLLERIDRPGQKKILACDGGGILGLISVEILARLEAELRAKLGKADLVLADYFDFVCGTSTGAMVAACIAAGMSSDQIRKFYVESGQQMFDKASLLKRLKYSYNDEPLAQKLRSELDAALAHPPVPGEANATLGDANLRSMLMMVMRNATTDSPWPAQQPARQVQPVRPPGLQSAPAALATAPGKHRRADFLPARGGHLRAGYGQGVSIRLRRRRRHHLQQSGFPGFPDGHRRALPGRLADRHRKAADRLGGNRRRGQCPPRSEGRRSVAARQRQEPARCADERRFGRLGHGLPDVGRMPLRPVHRP